MLCARGGLLAARSAGGGSPGLQSQVGTLADCCCVSSVVNAVCVSGGAGAQVWSSLNVAGRSDFSRDGWPGVSSGLLIYSHPSAVYDLGVAEGTRKCQSALAVCSVVTCRGRSAPLDSSLDRFQPSPSYDFEQVCLWLARG